MQSKNDFKAERMTPEQAAIYLGIAVGTLANLRSDPTGPDYFKLGGVFYRQADLDIYIETKKVASGPKA